MGFYDTVYDEPEKYGLELIEDQDDPDACYSFDIFAVWRHTESGKVYYASDAGCSCPAPFEDFKSIESLTPLDDWDAFVADVDNWLSPYDNREASDEVKMRRHLIKVAAGKALTNA